MKKIMTWNVNGLRAIFKKDFQNQIKESNPDMFCLQETKLSEVLDELKIDGYYSYFFNAKRKGYSGTAIYTKEEPLNIKYGIDIEEFDDEGRTLTAEFSDFYLVTSYTPNAQDELKRIDYRLRYDNALKEYLLSLNKTVILCGDLNVAHKPIDLKNPKSNEGNAGYSIQERDSFTDILNAGYIDIFRAFNPDLEDAYTWWSYRFNARARNIGWRIDYFITDSKSIDRIKDIKILDNYLGSDHAPIELIIK